VAWLAVLVLALAGCGGGSSTTTAASASGSASESVEATPSDTPVADSAEPTVPAVTKPVRTTGIGVSVTGDVGQKPALTVPASSAPSGLKVEVLVAGTGAAVAKGQTMVANYLGQTWTPTGGKVNVFDNSYDRSSPAAFQIGTGKVIDGWDAGLVGQRTGSRLLLSIPAAQAYGAATSADNALAGQDLLFVVDILGALDADAAATGTAVTPVPAGFPAITSVPGKKPSVTSVAGVKPTAQARSALLVRGTGAAIDPKKFLVLQIVQTDTATGKQTQGTWGEGAEVVPATDVLAIASVLKGQKVGSRVLAVTATSSGSESVVVILDVIAQY
jgi:peptidylprolyl isomerase